LAKYEEHIDVEEEKKQDQKQQIDEGLLL